MSKFMDKVYKSSIWILISVLLIGYFFYETLTFTGSIGDVLTDWRSWVHVLFVVYLNVTMVSGAFDTGTNEGLKSGEFDVADKLNNEIVKQCNNEMQDFREFIKRLNAHELQSIREDYLFSIGDKTVEELTPEERAKYDALKPIQHNIYGFNLPLYYEITKNGKVEYQASIKKDEGKRKQQIKRGLMGIIFSAMTLNVVFSLDSVGDAFVSLLVIASGLISTFLLIYLPQVFKFKYELPKKVLRKATLWESYVSYKNGTHTLRTLKEEPKEIEAST